MCYFLSLQYFFLADKPLIVEKEATIVNESNRVTLTREIYSNPLSNVSWYNGPNLLKSEITVNTTNLVIEKAECTDTKNFTLVASNTLEWKVTSQVELIVNCEYAFTIMGYVCVKSDGLIVLKKCIAFDVTLFRCQNICYDHLLFP